MHKRQGPVFRANSRRNHRVDGVRALVFERLQQLAPAWPCMVVDGWKLAVLSDAVDLVAEPLVFSGTAPAEVRNDGPLKSAQHVVSTAAAVMCSKLLPDTRNSALQDHPVLLHTERPRGKKRDVAQQHPSEATFPQKAPLQLLSCTLSRCFSFLNSNETAIRLEKGTRSYLSRLILRCISRSMSLSRSVPTLLTSSGSATIIVLSSPKPKLSATTVSPYFLIVYA